MSKVKSPMRGVAVTLQDAATSGSGLVIAIPPSFANHEIIIKGSAGVSAGAVQPEVASSADYAGDWAALGGGPITVLDDGEVLYSFVGLYSFLKVRISTPIVDGTVTVTYKGN